MSIFYSQKEQNDKNILVPILTNDSHNLNNPSANPEDSMIETPQVAKGCWNKVKSWFKKPPPTSREIRFDGHVIPENKEPNIVKNQKYNVITFIPLVLYNEFKLFFNLFFLLTAVTQFIPPLQTGYLISYIGPLALVLSITAIKEFVDDFLRYRRDKEANSAPYRLITGKTVPSSALKVGDIIEVHSNQHIPADLVLLYTSEPTGSVFIRTDQLDGETDWKLRKAIRYTQKYESDHGNLVTLHSSAKILANPPLENIYEFEGVFVMEKENGEVIKEPLTLENTLWSNTVLAAGKIYAMVVYTGKETRSVMNARDPRTKVSQADLEINLISKVLFVFLMGLSLLLVALQGFGNDWYVQLIRFITLLSTIIPISIRVNMDFAKLTYSYRINSDKDIPGTQARNRSIPEDLGRIQYLLSDKTGTLTKNEMVLKKIALENGKVFSMDNTQGHIKTLKKGFDKQYKESKDSSESPSLSSSFAGGKERERSDSEASNKYNSLTEETGLGNSGLKKSRGKKDKEFLQLNFWRAIALCHNVTPIFEDGKKSFQASSPDEIALVEAAEELEMKLVSRDQDSLSIINSSGNQENYQILANFPFASETKRMGIVLKNKDTGKITFYLKGADMVMEERVASSSQKLVVQDICDTLAQEGLRTLVITQKSVTEEEFAKWKAKYDEASHALTQRTQKMQSVIETLENDMDLLGITGVEDKLQDNVANTLENMKNAGIKVWMLTGDKLETAITVATSAGLRLARQEMFIMKEVTDIEDVKFQLKLFMNKINTVLIIDGKTLEVALEHCSNEFFEATTLRAPAIVCCRCSPTQKATITEGVKKLTKKRTCAIGDGGNDVAMIQAADIGIGVEGKEGKQAALSADYSIPKFEYLNKLVLWHGRTAYKGSAVLAHFVIHRGLIISFLQAIFSLVFYDLSISIYTGILNLGYTTIFTWLPVLSLLFDKDVDEVRALQYPALYKTLQKGRELNLKSFFIWLWWSLYQGAVIMLCTIYMFDNSYYNIVTITFTALIAAELFNVWTTLHRIHKIAIISVCCSMSAYIGVIVFLKKDINASAITLKFLYNVVFLTIVSWLPLHIITLIKNKFAPSDEQKIMKSARKVSSYNAENASIA